MRFPVCQVLAPVLLLGLALGQEAPAPSASTPSPTIEQPAPLPSPPPGSSSAQETVTPSAVPIDLKPDSTGVVPQEQIRELMRRVGEKDIENEKRLRDYTYVQREEQHHLDGHGDVKKTESRTSEVLVIYGEQVERLVAKDDKPLSAGDAKKEEERIQKITDKRKNESDSDHRKRLEKEEKDREEGRKFVLEIADAFNFHLLGSELVGGHDTWVLEGEPRPGYEPKSRETKMMSKFKGRLWVDKAEVQLVKLDVTAIDTISVGFFLVRVHKGANVVIEQTRVNDEVWLPKHVQFRLDVRLGLIKNYNEDVEQTFRDYKKFRTDTKITVVGESQ
jgi:hypothetical protein